jgi:hypothetical protein
MPAGTARRERSPGSVVTEWVALLVNAGRQGRLEEELRRLERIPLVVVDEVGCAPRGAMQPGGSVAHRRPP